MGVIKGTVKENILGGKEKCRPLNQERTADKKRKKERAAARERAIASGSARTPFPRGVQFPFPVVGLSGGVRLASAHAVSRLVSRQGHASAPT